MAGSKPRGAGGETAGKEQAFTACLRHDLRTPINAVLGYTELLLEDLVDGNQAELFPELQEIQAAAHRLLELTNELPALDQRPDAEAGEAGAALTSGLEASLRPPAEVVLAAS